MSHFAIKKPMWNGRYIGLADQKITPDNTIEILYTDKEGQRLYPNRYKMSGAELRKFQLRQFRVDMPALRMVPIKDLKIELEESEK